VWFIGNILHPQSEILRIWSVPIIFEFLLGFYIAFARNAWLAAGRALPRIPAVNLLVAAILVGHILFFGRNAPFWINAMVGLLTVSLCVLTQSSPPKDMLQRGMVRLGDSSYSLYLSHNLALLVVGVLWRGIFGAEALWAYMPIMIATALAVGHLCYLLIEQPGTKWMRKALG
jgi:peptidoglycan/LPS O-acetylase OafA/YrhL